MTDEPLSPSSRAWKLRTGRCLFELFLISRLVTPFQTPALSSLPFIHRASNVKPLVLKMPPLVLPRPLSSFIWMPFDRPEHALGYGRNDADFNKDETCQMTATTPKPADPSMSPRVLVQYHLHRHGQDASILAGSAVLSCESMCPPFKSCPNRNLFQQFFALSFITMITHTFALYLLIKFSRCFGLIEDIQYRLSHERYKFGLNAAMPGRISSWIFDQVHTHLVYMRDANSKIFSPNQFAAPAATIQTLVNGAICTRLPSRERWAQAYANDTELRINHDLVLNPSKITNKSFANVNHNYRGPLRQSLIVIENDMLILHEPITGTSLFARLQLVPAKLMNIVFIAFHTNAIGGHLNAYQTFHRLRLHFYWPGMYSYVKHMCQACPGCALANPTRGKLSELVYNFPVEAPFLVMFFNAYSAGKHTGCEGSECYLIGCCGMCSFACMEPITRASATTFASSIMKILLR
jgi:hypothetical protein